MNVPINLVSLYLVKHAFGQLALSLLEEKKNTKYSLFHADNTWSLCITFQI